ncbi:MAG: phosphoglucosamine mutase [Oligoflexia bacterium]|nr:phosphoglucosamine mutase [Bdellovibrionales bacterium]MYE07232.1 phosphoglucosamine mutase [Oligoflexia bacterium]
MLSGKKCKLFGTDGIRGKSNSFPIRPDIVLKVGQALGYLLRKNGRNKKMVLIGKDTRLSGYMLEQALASGLNSMGVWVQLTGPLPTPGIGFLAQNMRAEAGIVISASHNPYYDNGIKFFDAHGFKMSKTMEEAIEELVFSNKLNKFIVSCDRIGRSRRIDDSAGRYIVHVKNTFPLNMTLDGMRVVLDCAHGACYKVAPKIFEELGAEVFVIGNKPTGYNINEQTGALHTDKIQQAVLDYKADVGISLDGDGDRVIMADEKGELVDGDHILGICALSLQKKGELQCPKVVATSMSNMGLEIMLKKKGIQVERTEPGDRNVVEYMRQNNISLGGEPSGHIIFLSQSTTGDACVAALNVLAVMRTENKKLSELSQVLVPIPQVQRSVKIKKKKELQTITGYNEVIEDIKKGLQNKGRICVRYSGTEPIIRVLVEGKDKQFIQNCADKIAHLLSRNLNP